MRNRNGETRRRGLVGVAAVAAVAAISVGALTACSGSSSGSQGARPTATTSTQPAPVAMSSAEAAAPTSAAPSTTASGSGTKGAPMQPSPSEQVVGKFYGIAEWNQAANQGGQYDTSSFFASPTVAAKYWNTTTSKATAATLCGATAPNLVLVAGGGPAVTVSLYAKGKLAAQQAQVTVDPAHGTISAIACVPAATPGFPGTAAIIQNYSADGGQSAAFSKVASSYAPVSADGPAPWINANPVVCAQYPPSTWTFYAPVATASGSAWAFGYDTSAARNDVFVDPATGAFERTLCGGFPAVPAPNQAAAGKSTDGQPDAATQMVTELFDAYLSERAQVSAGAVPTDEMVPYFDSPAAYDAALHATGTYPFLCSGEAPDRADIAAPTVAGSAETFAVTLDYDTPGSGPSDHPVILGHEKVVIDLDTMKIRTVMCS